MKNVINRKLLIQAVFVAVCAATFFCFLLPLQTFLANRSLFEVGLGELLWQSGLLTIVVSVTLGVVLAITTPILGNFCQLLVVAIMVCAYLESGILSVGLPTLNGDPYCFTDILRKIYDSAILAIIFIALMSSYKYIKEYIHWIAVGLNIMMIASLFDVGGKQSDSIKKTSFSSGYCSKYEVARNARYSSHRNVLLISIDAGSGDVIKELFEEEKVLREQFSGFTYYFNTIGMHEITVRGYPGLLTGEYYDPKCSLGDYAQSVFSDKSLLFPYLKVNAGLYVNPGVMHYGYTNQKLESSYKEERPVNKCVFLRRSPEIPYLHLFDVMRFRLVPYKFKATTLVSIFQNANKTPNLTREKDLFALLAEGKIDEDSKLNMLCFHTRGTHVPITYNREGELLPVPLNTQQGLKDQSYYVLSEIGKFLRRLRERGIYDNSTIILATDHGASVGSADGHCGAPQVFLMIKPTHASGDLRMSRLPTGLSRVAPVARCLSQRDLSLEGIEQVLEIREPRLYRAKLLRDINYRDVWFDVDGSVMTDKSPAERISEKGWLLK